MDDNKVCDFTTLNIICSSKMAKFYFISLNYQTVNISEVLF